MATIAELDVSEEFERLAVLANEGYDVVRQAQMLCARMTDEEFGFGWDDFRQATRDRDDIAPPATRDWQEVISEDAASSQDEAYQVLCERADEALAVLRYGRPGERWLPVPDWEDLYEVSNLGRVWGISREGSRGGILKPHIRRGYDNVALSRNGTSKYMDIHRLVMLAFVGPCPEGQNVRHGRGGKRDNSLANLSYGTFAENIRDMIRDGVIGRDGDPVVVLTAEIVTECRIRYANGELIRTLAAEFGVSRSGMRSAIRGRTWRDLEVAPVTTTPARLPRAKKTHCVNSHEFTPENTWIRPRDNARVCRICSRASVNRSAEKRRAERSKAA